jgi:hypothetical protein
VSFSGFWNGNVKNRIATKVQINGQFASSDGYRSTDSPVTALVYPFPVGIELIERIPVFPVVAFFL